jgi:hypothetical protein
MTIISTEIGVTLLPDPERFTNMMKREGDVRSPFLLWVLPVVRLSIGPPKSYLR